MSQPEATAPRANVVGFGLQERRLGSTILRTYRQKLDIDDVVPNERQPRLGPKEDEELQRQIEANEGLFGPLLVEPLPDMEGKYRIIDEAGPVDGFAGFPGQENAITGRNR